MTPDEIRRVFHRQLGGFTPSVDAEFDEVDITDLRHSIAQTGTIDLVASSIGIVSDLTYPVSDWIGGRSFSEEALESRRNKLAQHRISLQEQQQSEYEEQQRQKQLAKERTAEIEWQRRTLEMVKESLRKPLQLRRDRLTRAVVRFEKWKSQFHRDLWRARLPEQELARNPYYLHR